MEDNPYYRYVRSRRARERVMASVRGFLEKRLRLKVNEAKSAADRPWKRKFLGFSFLAEKQIRVRLAPQMVERLKAKLRKFTSRTWSIDTMPERIKALNRYLMDWVGYFALAETPSVFERLDEWIRRRLRMDLWKQWKRPRTCYRELRRLGIPDEPAREVAGSSKGYWRLSATPQLHKALSQCFRLIARACSLSLSFLGRCSPVRSLGRLPATFASDLPITSRWVPVRALHSFVLSYGGGRGSSYLETGSHSFLAP